MDKRKFTDQETVRREKLQHLKDKQLDPFAIDKFIRNYNSSTLKSEFEKYTKEELHENTTEIRIAGRVMAIRQSFGVIKDFLGKTQFYINKKTIDPKV
jgi:lysyl-tRNA synthetase class 2